MAFSCLSLTQSEECQTDKIVFQGKTLNTLKTHKKLPRVLVFAFLSFLKTATSLHDSSQGTMQHETPSAVASRPSQKHPFDDPIHRPDSKKRGRPLHGAQKKAKKKLRILQVLSNMFPSYQRCFSSFPFLNPQSPRLFRRHREGAWTCCVSV